MAYETGSFARTFDQLKRSASEAASYAPTDPRSAIADRLPERLQPFLTWLTARPREGEPIRDRSPLYFVRVAAVQIAAGVLMAALALRLPALPAVILMSLGWLVACAGLGLVQVVVFHHCSHGTVFKRRETNILVGRMISTLLLFKHFDAYKSEHMLHHNHNKLLTDEDEFAGFVFGMCGLEPAISKRRLWRRVLVCLVSPWFHGRFLVRRIRAAWISPDRTGTAVGAAVWLGLVLLATVTGQLATLLWAWVIPLTILLQVATVFRILCEHRFPEPEMILARGKDFAAHATAGVFPGSMPPSNSPRTLVGLGRWALWWADMLTVQLFVRLFVLVGDAPCHDYHHRRPASRKWTSYIQAREADLGKSYYQESWGLFRAIDENLASLARTPHGLVG